MRRVVFYHRTTGGVAGSLYVLAIDQVAIATNQVSSVDCTPPGGTQGAGTLSDPQAPLCTPADYGLYAVFASGTALDPIEIDDSLARAADYIDLAFSYFVGDPPSGTSINGSIFRQVMMNDPGWKIAFVFSDKMPETNVNNNTIPDNQECIVYPVPYTSITGWDIGALPQEIPPATATILAGQSNYNGIPHQAVVDCGSALPDYDAAAPGHQYEYVFVHVLGDNFIERTGGRTEIVGTQTTFFGYIYATTFDPITVQVNYGLPAGSPPGAPLDIRIEPVIGPFEVRDICIPLGRSTIPGEVCSGDRFTANRDWRRDNRGWGSSAPEAYYDAATGGIQYPPLRTACVFQQSPIEGERPPSDGALPTFDEVIGTGRDLFLNWVYEKNNQYRGSIFGGFEDADWRGVINCETNPAGHPDTAGDPGPDEVLDLWMDTVVDALSDAWLE